MIFGEIRTEDIVQVNDKTRIDASETFKTPDQQDIKEVQIRPSGDQSFITVSSYNSASNGSYDKSMWKLDWSFATAGEHTITLKIITSDYEDPETLTEFEFDKTIQIISKQDDALFSTDEQLVAVVSDILKWIPDGRNSFKREHREAQKRILAWLDENGWTDTEGNKLTKQNIVDVTEVQEWSKYLTLMIIYENISNAVDDVFFQKARQFEGLANTAKNRKYYRFDYNNDGEIDGGENQVVTTTRLYRA